MIDSKNGLKKCDLCHMILKEGGKDLVELSKPYEIPTAFKWEGTNCKITNTVVKHMCAGCLKKITNLVQNL